MKKPKDLPQSFKIPDNIKGLEDAENLSHALVFRKTLDIIGKIKADVSRETGIDKTSLSLVFNGDRKIGRRIRDDLLEYYKVNPDFLNPETGSWGVIDDFYLIEQNTMAPEEKLMYDRGALDETSLRLRRAYKEGSPADQKLLADFIDRLMNN